MKMIWRVTQKGHADRNVALPLTMSVNEGDFVDGLGAVAEVDEARGNLRIAARRKTRRRPESKDNVQNKQNTKETGT